MRGHPVRLWSLALLLAAAGARAQPSDAHGASMRIEAPTALVPGIPASVAVFVRLPPGPAQPLLLTPSAEGEAVRVVRGRLLRADARETRGGELRFDVPIETRGEGVAVLRVALLTYRCTARCEAVRVNESRTLEVRAR